MAWSRSLAKRLRALLFRREVERELDDELRFHIDMQTEENLRRGMSAEEARRQAILLFGGVEGHREAARDARGVRLLDEMVADARYAARGLGRSPGFTLVAVATLALGIGANSALFSLANGLLWTPPPGVREVEGLTRVEHLEGGRQPRGLSYPDVLAFRDEGGVFAELAALSRLTIPLGGPGEPEQLRGEMVTANFFSMLRMRPALGRGFAPGEDRGLGSHPVVVLSSDLWERRFGASPEVLGRQVTLGGTPFTVIGVAAEGFRGLSGLEAPVDLWVPVTMYREASPVFRDTLAYDLLDIDSRGFAAVGRLKPGIAPEEAIARLDVLTRRAAAARPGARQNLSTRLTPLGGVLSTSDGDAALFFIWGGVTMIILLIACGNVANLILARAAGRSREIAVRAALGASRGRIVRQLLVESLLLALLGGAGGLLAGVWMLQLLIAFLPIPVPVVPGLDGRVLLVTLAAALLTGIVFGLSPALRASRTDLNIALRDATHGGRGRVRPQRVLIAAQLALSFVLLSTAGLVVMNMREALAVESIYSARDHVLTLAVDLRGQGYLEEQRASFKREMVERLSALPGVESVSLASDRPGRDGWCIGRVAIDGVERVSDDWVNDCTLHGSVGADYFATVGAPLVRGREFTAADRDGAPKVAIINETAARLFWPGADPIGRQVRMGADTVPSSTVVGIAPDALDGGKGNRRRPTVYWSEAQEPSAPISGTIVLLRTRGDPARLAGPVRAEIRAMDPNLPVLNVATLRAALEENRSEGAIAGTLLLVFGALALCLTLVGLHGLVAFTVVQRTREVGLRMALGARRGEVLALFGRDTLRMAGSGVALGLVLALGTAPLMNLLLNGLEPRDALTVLGVAGILLSAALAATVLPARRATRVDAMVALRAE